MHRINKLIEKSQLIWDNGNEPELTDIDWHWLAERWSINNILNYNFNAWASTITKKNPLDD